MMERVVEVEQNGPEHREREEDSGDFAAGGEGELRGSVGTMAFAEAVFERGAGAAVAVSSQVKAL